MRTTTQTWQNLPESVRCRMISPQFDMEELFADGEQISDAGSETQTPMYYDVFVKPRKGRTKTFKRKTLEEVQELFYDYANPGHEAPDNFTGIAIELEEHTFRAVSLELIDIDAEEERL